MLRVYFRYDRGLLNGLCRAAYGAIGTYLGELMGSGFDVYVGEPIRRWWTGSFDMWAGVAGIRLPSF